MEKVTHEMSLIARETKTETVSMKIITLVTLFFLPGTFVAVSILLLLFLVSFRCVQHDLHSIHPPLPAPHTKTRLVANLHSVVVLPITLT